MNENKNNDRIIILYISAYNEKDVARRNELLQMLS